MNTLSQQILQDVESLPPHLQEEVRDFVRCLKLKQDSSETGSPKAKREQISTLLARIASRGTAFSNIEDPLAWQDANREDLPLLGRE